MFKPIKDLEEGEVFIMATSSGLKVYSVIRVCPKSIVVSCRKNNRKINNGSDYVYEVFEEDIDKHNSTKRVSTNYRLKDHVYVMGRVGNP